MPPGLRWNGTGTWPPIIRQSRRHGNPPSPGPSTLDAHPVASFTARLSGAVPAATPSTAAAGPSHPAPPLASTSTIFPIDHDRPQRRGPIGRPAHEPVPQKQPRPHHCRGVRHQQGRGASTTAPTASNAAISGLTSTPAARASPSPVTSSTDPQVPGPGVRLRTEPEESRKPAAVRPGAAPPATAGSATTARRSFGDRDRHRRSSSVRTPTPPGAASWRSWPREARRVRRLPAVHALRSRPRFAFTPTSAVRPEEASTSPASRASTTDVDSAKRRARRAVNSLEQRLNKLTDDVCCSHGWTSFAPERRRR
ncbi:predicted protein [Streptomyces sp. AA4]|nr:predicted protein [Streptomyces sp. AA4]